MAWVIVAAILLAFIGAAVHLGSNKMSNERKRRVIKSVTWSSVVIGIGFLWFMTENIKTLLQ
ncbi:hypothetical protein LF817_18525 [Halobacillus sp. A1]|uniref:hypothetical protein n=1 Tax=Halobacillus sp. A1 TaxID=2880262 RepID=UPI0020A6768E|nr:hypothetical protein [Halobacillus sp. A1]MCP3033325.1 hypothetical protein [Halobacillus sp. A1]